MHYFILNPITNSFFFRFLNYYYYIFLLREPKIKKILINFYTIGNFFFFSKKYIKNLKIFFSFYLRNFIDGSIKNNIVDKDYYIFFSKNIIINFWFFFEQLIWILLKYNLVYQREYKFFFFKNLSGIFLFTNCFFFFKEFPYLKTYDLFFFDFLNKFFFGLNFKIIFKSQNFFFFRDFFFFFNKYLK